jgi:ketosteroid isomerase-like protein
MTTVEAMNVTTVRAYLAVLEAGVVGEALARFLTADAAHVELPNRFKPNGDRSDLAKVLARAEQGQKLMQRQSYEIKSLIAQDTSVAVEVLWTGILAAPLGSLPAGGAMKAHSALFFQLVDGRIAEVRSYDCFEPW